MKRLAALGGFLLITLLLSAPLQKPLYGSGSADAVREEEEHEGKSALDLIYKIVNFAILVGGLSYILRKPLADFFAERTATIRKELGEGRKALEASQARLKSVEEKMEGLEQHIAILKETAEKEEEDGRVRRGGLWRHRQLCAEVTLPRQGPPRPIRLGVKKGGLLTPLDLD